jgi:uncharacterized protein YdhG (YjbR/CyaY superfamily)
VHPDVRDYLAALDEPRRAALAQLRQTILELVPGAEEGLAYGLPAYRLHGRAVAGFAAFTDHLSYLPHSGSVLAGLGDELDGYRATKGSLHFTADRPLPRALVARLLELRCAEAGVDAPGGGAGA